ncbi:ribonuclease Z [Stieleria maiorica]|uniref:Ribonuclease Z n=1 Tax=Stieleria maiorica TaxID=2795974 RepID=A0A5B9MLL7_9BACT|nr:MBL fold metallo-hydrolase [Stieleria maiorica]QEG00416.1 ribonuclease Z [Stieleria maiorica]
MSPTKPLTITGYSTALFSTWYFIDELACLFDCGDGMSAGLLQKSRKIRHVFISHADRDHLAGLLQFNQLNARPELSIHFPRHCGSFPALAAFSGKFDPQVTGTKWLPLDPGDEVQLRADLVVRAVANRHIESVPSRSKSLSYFVEAISRKLKPEHLGKPGDVIAALRSQKGERAITEEHRRIKLAFSGDTPIETDGRYDDAEVLIHESTFLSSDEIAADDPCLIRHSALDQVMEMASNSRIGTLILGHFSTRYHDHQILEAIDRLRERYKIEFPIKVVLPGQIGRDVLADA